ncbi:Gfo/Idh/MocA family oxidoreductase [Vallitalea pronyensis]|uniref:Gfo/Idh/MocA family oxidoreductase n=1 Tax=Vallitalea pronyensis TaxID=1348613 RepID=A0A8J8MKD0_9FIRM|nr:Gfo/Idh/MocA family oxidoreductase [Vallitalea pronyensis]QUI22838.1 Gfo/Idh/MocA family oxidoreductase [Vallitalea pronyensis]
MKRVRLAVIGTGMAWDRLHLPAIQELGDKYEIVAMANLHQDKLWEAADKIGLSHEHTYVDYHEMLKRKDIDAVNVVVPISMNYKISRDVVNAGKNLICEKPLAPNMEEAIDFVKLQKERKVKIMIGENFRYNEENIMIKKLIEEKKIGDVLYFMKNNIFNFEECMTGDSFAAKEWRQHPDFQGGMILDAGVHDIAELRYIFGDMSHVAAFGNPIGHEYAPFININCNLMFKSGVVGYYVYCSKGHEAQKPSLGLRIFGTEGMIYLEDTSCSVVNVFYNDGRHEMLTYIPSRGYYNEFANFYEAMVNNQKIKVTPLVEFGDTKLIFALLESAKDKRVVTIDDSETFITDHK